MQQTLGADRNGVQVIARAAAILRAVGSHPRGMTLTEIAAEIDLARSTVQRIVGALVEEEFLVSAGVRAGFALGPALARLASLAVTDTEKLVRPVLEALSAATTETVDLSLLQSERAIFVDQVIGTARLVASSAVGTSFPLYPTANGKALLACVPKHLRHTLLPSTLEQLTPNTLTDRSALEAAIEAASLTGVAFDLEEHEEGVCAIGSAFVNRMGRSFAVSIPVPSTRFFNKKDQLQTALIEAMAAIASLDP